MNDNVEIHDFGRSVFVCVRSIDFFDFCLFFCFCSISIVLVVVNADIEYFVLWHML